MNFGEAMNAIASGEKARRAGWATGHYLFFAEGECLTTRYGGSDCIPALTSADREATDWSVGDDPADEPRPKPKEAHLSCSFCGKSMKEVTKLVAGPSVYICNECIELCNHIIEDEKREFQGPTPDGTTASVDPIPGFVPCKPAY